MSEWQPPSRGALDDTQWPERLIARAVDAQNHRVHGYDVIRDVSKHYTYSDLSYLAIRGELPDARSAALFYLGLCSVTAIGVSDAPAHVGVLSRMCGGSLASAIGAASIALADEARQIVEGQRALVEWLATRKGPQPLFEVPANHAWYAAVKESLDAAGVVVDALSPQMSQDAVTLTILYEAGLVTREHLEAALILARLNGVIAEVLVTGPQHLRDYPVKLPPFHYVGG